MYHSFVGLDISRNREKRTLTISQPDFIQNIFTRYNMEKCDSISIPANPIRILTPKMCPGTEMERREMRKKPFRECIGSLMYLMAMTRPDIALAVNKASAYVSDPGEEHWTAVMDILKYLKRTPRHGIAYGETSDTTLLGYTDADWASDVATN